MPSFTNVVSGATVQASDVQQLIDALKGTAGLGIPLSPTAVNDSVNFALAVKNTETTNSRALQVLRANNVVLLQADANGLVGSVDGIAAAAQLVNVSLAQTLTNKTLTSPHFTSPVVDSGGLTVTAGGLTVSAGVTTLQAVSNTGAITQVNSAAGAVDNLILKAGGNAATDESSIEFANQSGTLTNRIWGDATAAHLRLKAGGVLHLHAGSADFTTTGEVLQGAAGPNIGFLGTTAVGIQTIGAAAVDAGTTQTLANNIRTALRNFGLCN